MLTLNGGRTIAERAQNASSRSLAEVANVTFNLGLEFLNTCEFHCSGCYVNRRNNFSDDDLNQVSNLTEQLSTLQGVELNEILVGPTDFFSTENVEPLFERKQFRDLFNHFKAITITSTLQSAPKTVAELKAKTLDILPKGTHVELFVSLDVERFVANDIMYLTTLESNLKIMQDANILFIFNMFKHPLFERYAEVAKLVNDRYNSHLKMNPSFFRGKKSSLIKRELSEWKQTIELAVRKSSLSGVLMNVADDYFGGNTYITLAYKQGKLYLNPCFYDYVLDEQEMFRVPQFTVDSVFELIDDLSVKQYEYAKDTSDCSQCELLASCISKKVLSSMEQHGITDCLMPREIIRQMRHKDV